MNDKKPDLVVYTKDLGYDAKFKSYPTNVGAPAFTVPDVSLFRTESSKKMIAAFERERQEIVEKIEKLQDEYTTSMMVWEAKISFEPIVGRPYHLYNFDGEMTLSLIAPNEWSKGEFFVGTFILNSDNKWIKN